MALPVLSFLRILLSPMDSGNLIYFEKVTLALCWLIPDDLSGCYRMFREWRDRLELSEELWLEVSSLIFGTSLPFRSLIPLPAAWAGLHGLSSPFQLQHSKAAVPILHCWAVGRSMATCCHWAVAPGLGSDFILSSQGRASLRFVDKLGVRWLPKNLFCSSTYSSLFTNTVK